MRHFLIFCLLPLVACAPLVDRDLSLGSGVPLAVGALDTDKEAVLSAFLHDRGAAIDAVVVLKEAEIVFSHGPVDTAFNLASVRKSVLSLLFGIAIERGLVDTSATLAELGIDERKTPLTAQEKTATVFHLLQSRSGVYLPADAETADARRTRPIRGAHAPGSVFHYNNWGFNVLGTIFENETGLEIGEAFAEWIATPTGMQDFHPSHIFFDADPGESDYPAYRMFLSARDLARLGAMVAQNGRWRGVQIVPKRWIKESATVWSRVGPPLSDAPIDGYGLSWWLDPALGDMVASGWGGQILYIAKSDGLVIAMANDTGNSALGHLWFRWFGARSGGRDLLRILTIIQNG